MKRYRNLLMAIAYIDSYRNKDFVLGHESERTKSWDIFEKNCQGVVVEEGGGFFDI